nr:hypothetical protein [Odoribacter sp.]
AFVSYSIRGYQEKATIDAKEHTVFLQLPDTVRSGANMCPEFEVTPGTIVTMNLEEQKSGAETLDFGNMQIYTLTSADGKSDRWYVNVTNNDYTASYGLGNFLTYSCSNNGKGDFYRQQQHTGEYSDVNCGPACAVMAALFIDPSYSGTIEEARQERPRNPKGGTSWYDNMISGYLYDHGIRTYWWEFVTDKWDVNHAIEQCCTELDWGAIAICCLDIYKVKEQVFQDKGYHTNKYYHTNNQESGHFLIVKGYCIVNGEIWFEVHDPWGLDMSYEDGSPMGANRYYRAIEVFTSALDWNNRWVLFVPPYDKQ